MTPAARGAAVALCLERALEGATRGRWERTNHRDREVSPSSGPALVVGALAGDPSWPAAVAGLGAAATGLYDDEVGGRDRAKGLRGHAAALRAGRVTGGAVKVVGIGGSSLLAVLMLPRRTVLQVVLDTALVAGMANLLNLFDLRPGRALKVGVAAGMCFRMGGSAGAGLALLPGDLRERTMLGDTGANGLGALLGLRLVERLNRRGRLAALAVVLGLVGVSESVSFTAVIERTPLLRVLDGAGRVR